jgi:hypothetical protein
VRRNQNVGSMSNFCHQHSLLAHLVGPFSSLISKSNDPLAVGAKNMLKTSMVNLSEDEKKNMELLVQSFQDM